ncbi:MAG: ribonuclease H-like domain-containing protein [Chloroflexi bacterium]|nr:ribonuclease H-like domain-containing protein [Chloroflexota bacterium]
MRHVDLLLYARDSFRLPTTSFKLKEVAGHFGFQWRHPDLRSILIPLYYREYVRTPKKNREARSNTGTQLLDTTTTTWKLPCVFGARFSQL